jgi:hypothetical protein
MGELSASGVSSARTTVVLPGFTLWDLAVSRVVTVTDGNKKSQDVRTPKVAEQAEHIRAYKATHPELSNRASIRL